MSAVVPISEARPNLVAGGRPTAIVPQTMDEAYRLAKAICMAQMAPKGLDTPEKAMVAIMHGLEVGLTPMAALQRIAVVNGRPTIWGDGAMGLVRGSGLCEYVHEAVTGTGEGRAAVCKAKRKGEVEPIVRSFSVADAKKAGLWGKSGPWTQYPDRMLAMRARAFALRDGFADVLGGLYLREELDDAPVRASREVPPAPPPAIAAGPGLKQLEPPAPPPAAEIVSAETGEIRAPQEIAAEIVSEIGDALNEEMLDHVLDARSDELEQLPRDLFAQIEEAAMSKRDAFRKASVLHAG